MAEVPNFRAKTEVENDKHITKEKPKVEEEGDDECELVAYSALPYGAIEEELASGLKTTDNPIIILKHTFNKCAYCLTLGLLNEVQSYENDQLVPDSNDDVTAENPGFLQLAPISCISLATSTQVTTGISETQVNRENTVAGLIMVQGNDGHREYVVAYPPIVRAVIKEETTTDGDNQNQCNFNEQVVDPNICTITALSNSSKYLIYLPFS